MEITQQSRPAPDEVEFSIFGPGFGECIVLHLGSGDWGIVDSCLEPVSRRPAALHYLESLKVDIAKAVRFVISTHWHDDHNQGISKVFQASTSAIFSCSAAIRDRDFDELLSSYAGTRFLPGGSGLDELCGVLVELKKRSADSRFPTPVLAASDKVLWERRNQPLAIVRALSPSNASLVAAIAQLKKTSPLSPKTRKRTPDIKPNDASVVLGIQVGDHYALLGADLEIQSDPALGWAAIVNNRTPSSAKHHGFKVPHHGSSTAHDDDVWNRMLVEDAWAATTPFVKGAVRLPTTKDCHRIISRTRNAYLTAPPRPGKFKDTNRAVERTVKESTRSIYFIPGKFGLVRMRKSISARPDAPWSVDLFGDGMTMGNYIKSVNP